MYIAKLITILVKVQEYRFLIKIPHTVWGKKAFTSAIHDEWNVRSVDDKYCFNRARDDVEQFPKFCGKYGSANLIFD